MSVRTAPLSGHRDESGIQNHSCGDIFPYLIVTVTINGVNHDQAQHNDGWRGELHPWETNELTGEPCNAFSHSMALGDIEERKAELRGERGEDNQILSGLGINVRSSESFESQYARLS